MAVTSSKEEILGRGDVAEYPELAQNQSSDRDHEKRPPSLDEKVEKSGQAENSGQ